MSQIGFREMLRKRQKKVNSLVCVGLDPLPEKLPEVLEELKEHFDEVTAVLSWMKTIVDATAPFTSMYKPQRAHYEAIEGGELILKKLIQHIHDQHPGIPVFLDCKRGDIGRTQARYAVAHLINDGADGMNFSPYMGKDCMSALVSPETAGKALVGLCYTSNPAARQIQDLSFPNRGMPQISLWEVIAGTILAWAEELSVTADAGLVMAAAYENPKGSGQVYSEHLKRCREIVKDMLWFLIPGIGTQGGFVKETVKAAFVGYGSIAINSSSGIIFASDGKDYAEAAAGKAEELRDQIRSAMP